MEPTGVSGTYRETYSYSSSSLAASGQGTYPAPKIPVTPSATINSMLEARCNKTFTSPVKFAVAWYICAVFTAITFLYKLINQKKPQESHTFWMVACGVVGLALIFKSWLIYNIIMAASWPLQVLIKYSLISLALAGAGLGVAAAVFFDKEGVVPISKAE